MIVVDEYLAVWSILGVLPLEVPDERLALPLSAHWRLLQRLHAPAGGQLSQALARLPAADREVLRAPDPSVLEVFDPRPRLDEAARLAARYEGRVGTSPKLSLPASRTVGNCGSAPSATSAGACARSLTTSA